MIQIIAAIIVAIWFFREARAVGKTGVPWVSLECWPFSLQAFPGPSLRER